MVKILLKIILVSLLLFLAACTVKQDVSLQDMKFCNTKEDCVVVDCWCSCSGGGFSYDDAVNKNYEKTWYDMKCHFFDQKEKKCPEVLCKYAEVVCENNQCIVKANERI